MFYNIALKQFYVVTCISCDQFEIIKVYAGQILPCGRVTGNKEFTIGGHIYSHQVLLASVIAMTLISTS